MFAATTTPIEWWTLGLAAVTAVGATIAVVIYGRQLSAMQAQVSEQREQRKLSELLQLFEMLQTPTISEARGHLYATVLRDGRVLQLPEWNRDTIVVAQQVGMAYQAVGFLASLELVEPDVLKQNWGRGARDMWSLVKPYVDDRRRREKNLDLWKQFEDLAILCGWHPGYVPPRDPEDASDIAPHLNE